VGTYVDVQGTGLLQGTPEGVENANGTITRVGTFPIGIDPERFTRALEGEEVQSHVAKLLNRYAGRKVGALLATTIDITTIDTTIDSCCILVHASSSCHGRHCWQLTGTKAATQHQTLVKEPRITAALGPPVTLQIMLGVDRLDMVKGIPQKLLAFEKFLEEHAEWRDKVSELGGGVRVGHSSSVTDAVVPVACTHLHVHGHPLDLMCLCRLVPVQPYILPQLTSQSACHSPTPLRFSLSPPCMTCHWFTPSLSCVFGPPPPSTHRCS
jgi:hypothetical protein